MADLTNPFADMLPSMFFAGDKNDPRVNPQLRQKIALAMMARDRKFPKNVGEGLSAIGDAIGDRALMTQLMDADVAQQGVAPPGAAASPAAAPVPYAPPSELSQVPAVKAIDSAMAPPVPAPPPPGNLLSTAPSQPGFMLGSGGLPNDINTIPAGQPSPDQAASLLSPRATLPPEARVPGPAQAAAPPPTGSPQVMADPATRNMIDAQAGFKRPTPGYIQDAITSNVGDPDRQAYLGSLVAGEAPRGPADVSPTGADGPFQFTRGTGRQYGLIGPQGDQRRDLNASVQAANQLTDDNAATFERLNGRPPTPADLAVLHQQGGTTGSRMIAGTGNAPAGNLAVNNIPAGTGPTAAAARIKAYYGMPDQRDQVAGALLAQRSAPTGAPVAPPPQPAMAFSGIQPAPPAPGGGIQPAPTRLGPGAAGCGPRLRPARSKRPNGRADRWNEAARGGTA